MDKTMNTGAMAAERCRILYEYLIRKGDQWTETIDAAEDLCGYYPYTIWLLGLESTDFHDSNVRMMITNDIRLINESGDFEKIIISGKRGIKIANEEEAERYIGNQYRAIFRRFKRLRVLAKKAEANGQININNETVKAFLEEGK